MLPKKVQQKLTWNIWINFLILHKKSIELFEKGSKATDLDIRDIFISGLPKIRSHYDMVQNTRQKMKDQKESQRKSGMK